MFGRATIRREGLLSLERIIVYAGTRRNPLSPAVADSSPCFSYPPGHIFHSILLNLRLAARNQISRSAPSAEERSGIPCRTAFYRGSNARRIVVAIAFRHLRKTPDAADRASAYLPASRKRCNSSADQPALVRPPAKRRANWEWIVAKASRHSIIAPGLLSISANEGEERICISRVLNWKPGTAPPLMAQIPAKPLRESHSR